MIVLDPDGTVAMANTSFGEFTGYSVDQIIGMRWESVKHLLSGNSIEIDTTSSGGPPIGQSVVPCYQKDTIRVAMTITRPVKNPNFKGWSTITVRETGAGAVEGAPEEAYRKLLHSIHLIIVLNPDDSIAFANQFSASFFGYSQDAMLNSSPESLFIPDPESRQAFTTLIQRAREGKGEIIWREFACRRQNGDDVWTSWVATPVGPSGQVLCVGYNRTGGKRAEEALAASEERFRIAAESACDFVYEIDLKEGSVNWFGPIDEHLGYSEGEIPRTIAGWQALLHPDDRTQILAAYDRHCTSKDLFEISYRVYAKDGSIRWWKDRGQAICDREGRPDRFIGVNVDITRRRQADEAIRRHLRYLSVTNRIAGIISRVAPFEEIIPAVIREVAGEIEAPAGAVILVQPKGGERRVWSIGTPDEEIPPAESEGIISIDFSAGDAGVGSLIFHKLQGVLSDDDEEIVRVASRQIGTFIERSHLREELALAYEDLSLFVDILVHDINNSTMVAMGYSEILKETGDQLTEGYITRILDCLSKNAEIISDVNTLRNLRAQKGNLTAVALDPVIRREIRHHEQVPIHYQGTEAVVLADDLISEIFTNLIGNAVKHGGPGIKIFITVEENDNSVIVRIADTGSGIPDTLKRRVLERHHRGESKASGSGLGLFIVKKLVERYGGTFRIEDRVIGHPDEGACMAVTFRRASDL
jgi:PAS domain S-box-containing protein